jgi:hypothetical protein
MIVTISQTTNLRTTSKLIFYKHGETDAVLISSFFAIFFYSGIILYFALIQSVKTKITSMEEKQISFTDYEIEQLHHICNKTLANDPNAEQAKSILQKIAQTLPEQSAEELITHTRVRGRRPLKTNLIYNPAPAHPESFQTTETLPTEIIVNKDSQQFLTDSFERIRIQRSKILNFILKKLKPVQHQ